MHHGTVGILVIVAALTFVFGAPAARVMVGACIILAILFLAYVMFRIAMGTV